MAGWITREEALARLGVRAQSLYAYVSRGRVAAMADPADPRRSLYNADDVAALTARQRRGRSRSAVASGSIAWGDPVLETAISTVAHGRLLYRGQDAVGFAERAGWEDAASLLIGVPPAVSPDAPGKGLGDAFAWLAAQVPEARPTHGRGERLLVEEAAGLAGGVARALGAVPADTVAQGFAQAWERADAADAIRRALVLMADHELNASTFATRVAASTGASLAACLLAGLATLTGPLHGGAATAALGFVRAARAEGARTAVRGRLDEGRQLPGFGHLLYVGIDPRAEALLGAVRLTDELAALRAAVLAETGQEPNIDFATAAIVTIYDLPDDAPIRLFAAARAVGWLGHSIEQARTGALIRPRARYVGAG